MMNQPAGPAIDRWQANYAELEAQILEAHEADSAAALIELYALAANYAERHHDTGAAKFFLTQAYVFALDQGDKAHVQLLQRLNRYDADVEDLKL